MFTYVGLLIGSPDRAEHDILGVILGVFVQFRPLLWSGLLGSFIEVEWLVTNVISVWFPDRVECDISGMILGVFC